MKVVIVNSALDNVPEISLRGMIDQYDDGSIASAIDSCPANKLRININSMGGNVMLGQEVIAAMQAFKNNGGVIETVNRGIAYSTAGWIFAAGTKGNRKMLPFAKVLTHAPMYADGTGLEDYLRGSEKHNALMSALDSLVDIFAPITGRTKNFIKKIMLKETTFNARQAIKEGFADEVVEISNVVNLKSDLQPEEIINATESIDYEIVNVLDNHKDNNNNNSMKKVATLLNLNPDASENSVVEALEALQNRVESAEADLTATRTNLTEKESELSSVQNELNELKDAEIINYVKKYVGDVKERKDNMDNLLNMAKGDFTTFKSVCPLSVQNGGKDAQIDNGIKPEGNEEAQKEAEKGKATEFKNMSMDARQKLKNSDVSKYNELVNAYDKYATEIF